MRHNNQRKVRYRNRFIALRNVYEINILKQYVQKPLLSLDVLVIQMSESYSHPNRVSASLLDARFMDEYRIE